MLPEPLCPSGDHREEHRHGHFSNRSETNRRLIAPAMIVYRPRSRQMWFRNSKFYRAASIAVNLCTLCVVACLAALAQAPALVIEGGTLIDGTGGAALPNSVVVVEGSRITAVGKRGSITYPKYAKVVKADGKTVLPGFIDGHIHFAA